ncbi:MAG TPA: hypothetical protein DHU59_08230 [Clostridiales bacterium]|nr:hypothetical protein [Clostridiales bacterium]
MDDPRPDLTADTELWTKFLVTVKSVDEQLAFTLHGFRCAGARLIKQPTGYVIRPEFNKDSLWKTQEEYEEYKKVFLVSHTDKIISCLNRLGGTV